MKRLLDELKRMSRNLQRILDDMQYDRRYNTQTPIKGRLVIKHDKDRILFYRFDEESKTTKLISLSDIETLAPLAQKRYDNQVLKFVTERKKLIDGFIEKIEKQKNLEDVSHIYGDLPPQLKAIVKPHVDCDEEYARQWQSYNRGENTYRNPTGFYSKKGEHMRSKSEVIIADRLTANDIPYYYEGEIGAADFIPSVRPDFLVLNKRERRVYVWEHMGRMDDPDYCAKKIGSMEQYAQAGFVQGVNMIVTFESSKHSLNTKYIDQIIKANFM